jgi:WD40 repeat protein
VPERVASPSPAPKTPPGTPSADPPHHEGHEDSDESASTLAPPPESTLQAAPIDEATLRASEPASTLATAASLAPVAPENYVREHEIARGGMGRIVAAHDRRLGRPVAIKELIVPTPDLVKRFEREALITARLEHPGIVSVHEAGRWPSGEPFFAMRLVAGRSLDRVISERKTLHERLGLLPNVIAVADALAYAHGKGIVHRDLKPLNVLCGDYGETVVVDWGLAKDLKLAPAEQGGSGGTGSTSAPDRGATVAGSVLGTPAYMPPEQARGKPIDARADVYALGALLYHVLSGKPPLLAETTGQILAKAMAGDVEPLTAREPDVPPDLAAIVAKAMAKEAADRYPTAKQLVDDLKRYQTGALVGARDYSAFDLFKRWLLRHVAVVGLSAAFLAILVALGILAIRKLQETTQKAVSQAERAQQAESTATASRNELILKQAHDALERDPTESIAWLARFGTSLPPGARIIAADALALGVAQTVLRGAADDPIFSPDGKTLYAVVGSQIIADDLEMGRVRVVAEAPTCKSVAGLVLRQERLVAVCDAGSMRGMSLYDTATGEVTVLPYQTPPGDQPLDLDPSDVERVATSPDGRYLIGLPSPSPVSLWDVDTAEVEMLDTGTFEVNDASFSPDGTLVALAIDDGSLRVQALADARQERFDLGDSVERAWFVGGNDAVAAQNTTGGVTVFRRRDHSVIYKASGYPGVVVADANSLWIGEESGIHHFDPARGEQVFALPGQWPADLDLSFTATLDGSELAWTNDDHSLFGFAPGADDGATLRGHDSAPAALVFSPDGQELVSCANDGLRVWSRPRPAVQRTLMTTANDFEQVTFSPDGRTLYASEDGPAMRAWDLSTGSPGATFEGATGTAMAMSRAGDQLAGTTLDDDAVLLFDRSGTPRWRTHLGDNPIQNTVAALAFSPSGRVLAAVSGQGRFVVLDTATGAPRLLGSGTLSGNPHLAWSPDERWLAVGWLGGYVQIFDAKAGNVAYDQVEPGTDVTQLLFSPEDLLLVVRSTTDPGASLRILDPSARTARPFVPPAEVLACALSPDGAHLALAAADATITPYDWPALRPGAQLLNAPISVGSLFYSPDGTQVAAADDTPDESAVYLWDVASGYQRRLDAGVNPAGDPDSDIDAADVVFTPDGRSLRAVTEDEFLAWPDDLPTESTALAARIAAATSATIDADRPLATALPPPPSRPAPGTQ